MIKAIPLKRTGK